MLHEHAVKLSTAKVHVFSDPVLSLGGRIAEKTSWTNRMELFTQSLSYRELDNLNGELAVFEWNIFPISRIASSSSSSSSSSYVEE